MFVAGRQQKNPSCPKKERCETKPNASNPNYAVFDRQKMYYYETRHRTRRRFDVAHPKMETQHESSAAVPARRLFFPVKQSAYQKDRCEGCLMRQSLKCYSARPSVFCPKCNAELGIRQFCWQCVKDKCTICGAPFKI
jgi:hypothetical protein